MGAFIDLLQSFARHRPILTFLVFCFGITWSVWFSVPLFSGADWALGKILVGAGFGPALAALAVEQLRGSSSDIGSTIWWRWFAAIFLILFGIYSSILLTGDAISASEFVNATAIGITPIGVLASVLSATVSSFIVASLVCSRSSGLNSILRWRVPLRWWLIALLLPAGWMILGLIVAYVTDSPIDSVRGGLDPLPWALFVLRSIAFTLIVVAIGEEAGWRGWLLPELQKRFNPLLSSLLLGIVWGLWHFPLYISGQYDEPPEMVFAKVGACVMLGVIFVWLYNRTGGNLLLAVVLHTTLNSTPRIIPFSEHMGLFLLSAIVAMILFDRMWSNKALKEDESRSIGREPHTTGHPPNSKLE